MTAGNGRDRFDLTDDYLMIAFGFEDGYTGENIVMEEYTKVRALYFEKRTDWREERITEIGFHKCNNADYARFKISSPPTATDRRIIKHWKNMLCLNQEELEGL